MFRELRAGRPCGSTRIGGTARDIALAEAYQVPIHICHVSSRTSVAMIRDAKRRGVQVTAETAPHYFSLTDAMLRARMRISNESAAAHRIGPIGSDRRAPRWNH